MSRGGGKMGIISVLVTVTFLMLGKGRSEDTFFNQDVSSIFDDFLPKFHTSKGNSEVKNNSPFPQRWSNQIQKTAVPVTPASAHPSIPLPRLGYKSSLDGGSQSTSSKSFSNFIMMPSIMKDLKTLNARANLTKPEQNLTVRSIKPKFKNKEVQTKQMLHQNKRKPMMNLPRKSGQKKLKKGPTHAEIIRGDYNKKNFPFRKKSQPTQPTSINKTPSNLSGTLQKKAPTKTEHKKTTLFQSINQQAAKRGVHQKAGDTKWKQRNKDEALARLMEIAGDDWDLKEIKEGDNKKRFDCPETEGYFPDKELCSVYYHCNHGVATREECRKGLVWNRSSGSCDWEENVDCH